MQILRSHPKPSKSESRGVRPSNLCLHKPPRWLWCSLKFESHSCKAIEHKHQKRDALSKGEITSLLEGGLPGVTVLLQSFWSYLRCWNVGDGVGKGHSEWVKRGPSNRIKKANQRAWIDWHGRRWIGSQNRLRSPAPGWGVCCLTQWATTRHWGG